MVSTVQSPSGRFIKYMGQRHRQYIKNKEMAVPNEYKALYSLKDKGKILFLVKKKKRKNAKVETGYEQEEIINPDIQVQPKESFRSGNTKLTKDIKKNIRKGKYYTNKPTFKEVFKNEKRLMKSTYDITFDEQMYGVRETNLLFLTNLIFNTYLNMKQSKTATYLIQAIFKYNKEDKNYDNFTSFVVRGETIKFEDIYRELKKLIPQTDGQHCTLYKIETTYILKPTSFGCNEKKTCKIKKFLKNREVVLYNPKSLNNNCLIMCFNNRLNIAGNGPFKPDTVRKKCGIPIGIKIEYNDVPKICDYYNTQGFNVGYIIYDEDFKPVSCYNCNETEAFYEGLNTKNIIHLYSLAEHCYYIIDAIERTCEKCNTKYIFKHNCSVSKEAFYNNKFDKNRCVQIKGRKPEDLLDYDSKLFFFDLETFKGPNNIKAVPYAVGWFNDGKYSQLYGKNSFDIFMDTVQKLEGKILTAYNGSSFDFYFLMEELLKRGAKITHQIFKNTKLMSFRYSFDGKKSNKMFDLCLFTMCALKNACKSFKTAFNKLEFDHTKIKSWEDVDTFRDEVEPYLEMDVLSFREVFIKFNDMIHELESVNITKFITLSSMAYGLNSKNIKHIIEIFDDYDKYTFVHKSMYGGRVHPLKRYSQIDNYDDVINGNVSYNQLKESGNFIYNADATSLYPSAMRGVELPVFWKWDRVNEKAYTEANYDTYYPVGFSQWSENGEEIFKQGHLGCYYVEFEPPKNIRFPYLLTKNEQKGVIHSLENGSGVYTCADLEGALIAGYKITRWGKCLYWKEKACKGIFDEFVDKYFKMKMIATKENNAVKRQIAKILLNSLFGKFLQQPIHDKVEICNSYVDVLRFMGDNWIKEFNFLDGKLLLKGTSKDELLVPEITKPSHLGCFILSYSKRIMLTYIMEIDPTLKGDLFSYTDTDSIKITGDNYKKLLSKGLINEGEEDRLGFLTNDIDDDAIIIREINIAPKCYYYEYIDKYGRLHINNEGAIKCKGLPKQYLDSGLYEDYINGTNTTNKEIKFSSMKKIGTTLTQKQKQQGLSYFNITEVEQTRTFCKSVWHGMVLRNENYYPIGYEF